ncbi:MAG: RNA polymerase sigma factor [bacterium]
MDFQLPTPTPTPVDSLIDDQAHAADARPLRPRRASRPVVHDESWLIDGLRLGDDAVFEWFMDHYHERLLAVARRYLSEEDARDAVQDALIALIRSIDGFEAKSALSTWLHRVVVNACLTKLRSRRRKPEESLPPTLEQVLATSAEAGLDRAFETAEVDAWVQDAIGSLPEPHRTVIQLRDIRQHDTRQTATLMNITPAAVKTRLHRARKILREQLERDTAAVA